MADTNVTSSGLATYDADSLYSLYKKLQTEQPDNPAVKDVTFNDFVSKSFSGDSTTGYQAKTPGFDTWMAGLSASTGTTADNSGLNLSIQSTAAQQNTVGTVTGNITNPTLPTGAEQTYTDLDTGDIAGGSQFQDPNAPGSQVEGASNVTAATVGTTATAAQPVDVEAAKYGAVQVNAQTPEAQAAEGAVTKLIDPQTGALSNEAVAAQGILDPGALVDAATSTISPDGVAVAQTATPTEKATMIGQLNELLAGLEGGNVPAWAKPAVDNVENALAARGLSKSTIGRDALFNAIIQAALPIAQNDAQTQAQFEAQNLTNRQQTALFNAQNVLQMDMANLSNEQQARLMNSQAIQTMTISNLNNRQQAAMTNAANWAAMDTANLSAAMTAQVENARNFLQMDLSNLSNEQQTALVNQQSYLQTLLGDQAAANAAKQFNASNQTQVDQFMAQLGANISQFNATQANAMSQFNVNEINAMTQFGESADFAREQFNAAMYTQIEQSNVTWRRQMNQIDTAGENAVNQANAINLFNLSNQALTLAWQELRDSASWAFQASENDQERDLRLAMAAITSENQKAELTANTWSSIGSFIASILN